MKKKKLIPLMLTCVVMGSVIASGCGPKQQAGAKQTKKAVPVATAVVKEGTIGANAVFTGQISPSLQTKVVSKISGKVAQVYVNAGDFVKAGQPLVQVDTTDLENQLRQQQAQLKQQQAQVQAVRAQVQTSEAQLEKAKTDAQNTYAQLLAPLQQAKIALDDAQTTFNRKQNLYQQGVIPKSDLDAAQTALDTARSKYEAAQQQVNQASPGGDPLNVDSVKIALDQLAQTQAQVAAAEAQVEQIQANIATTQSQIAQATVTSPVDGVVVSKDVEVGGFAGGQGSVATIAQIDPVQVNLNIPENMIDKVKEGLHVKVAVKALGNQTWDAVISRINPVEDTNSKSYQAVVEIKNPDEKLKPGMVAEVTVEGLTPRKALVIPANALVQTPDGAKVFTVENNVAHQHLLKLGAIESDQVEVLEGLKAGDVLVTEGQELLGEGTPVTVTNANGSGKSGGSQGTKGTGNAQGTGSAQGANGTAQSGNATSGAGNNAQRKGAAQASGDQQ
jgi:HlyD family secretion protein